MDTCLFLFVALIVALLVFGAVILILSLFHYREKKEIFDRYMATDFGKYQYYNEEYKKFVERKDEAVKEKIKREKNMRPGERKATEAARQF
jgi:FtsZ-interacting cell division protein ZipA